MRIAKLIASGLGLVACCTSFAQPPPEALRRMEASRTAIQTAHIEWSRKNPRLFGSHTRYYTTRLGVDNGILIQRGDEDGVFNRKEDDSIDEIQMQPNHTLYDDDELWQHQERHFDADYYPAALPVPRIHALGFSSTPPYANLKDTLWRDPGNMPGPRRYAERVDGGLHVVRCEVDGWVREWWLDPERGWLPIRATSSLNGELNFESRSSLKKRDGIWFADRVSYFSKGYKNMAEPVETVTVISASFNRPDHPQRFSVADIGIEVCTNIRMHDEQRNSLGLLMKWDGEKPVTLEEYNRRSRAGEISAGPTFLREQTKNQAMQRRLIREGKPNLPSLAGEMTIATMAGHEPKTFETLWDAYTRKFIDRYKLNDEQADRAWSICHECQEQGRQHVARINSDLERIDKRLAELEKTARKTGKQETVRLAEKRKELMNPLREIFERQLKPRLEKLPTRAQRRAAEAFGKSKPEDDD